MSIKAKITILSVVSIVMLSLLGGYLISQIKQTSGSLHIVIEKDLQFIREFTMLDMYHEGIRGAALESLYGALTGSPEKIKNAGQSMEEYQARFLELDARLRKLSTSKDFDSAWGPLSEEFRLYLVTSKEVIGLAQAQNLKQAEQKMLKVDELFKKLEEDLEKTGDQYQQRKAENLQGILDSGDKGLKVSIFGLAGTLAALIILSTVFSRQIVQSLRVISGQINNGAGGLGISISQLSSASEQLASSSQQQASAIEQTAASIEEITSMVKKTSDLATEAESAVVHSKQQAEAGQKVMGDMVTSIEDIEQSNTHFMNQVKQANKQIGEIVSLIQEIDSKTKVINEIVFQTKLLSFNASVEAARAGENGKGFSVVAEEVGNLAQMSGNAALEISKLLESSKAKAEQIVAETESRISQTIESSQLTISRGKNVVRECEQSFSGISKEVESISGMVSQISLASGEQSRGVDEISKAISQLSESMSTASAAAKNCAQTSENLNAQAADLRKVSSDLLKTVEGKITVSRFVWNDSYSLKIKSMDDEHKILIDKINKLAMAIEKSNGQPSREVDNAYAAMADYTYEHFATEEKFMDSFEYPDIEGHKKIHKRLLGTVEEYKEKIRRADFDPAALMNFLNDWLLKHILNVDMKYSEFYRSK